MPPPTPNPPGHRPYSTRVPAIPPQPVNASTGQAKTARSYGYDGTIDLGADGIPKGSMKNGQYVPFTNGKTPEQIQEEQAAAQQQRAEQERRAVAAQQAGVLQPKYDANGLLVGGINATTGEAMSMKGNQLVGDGKHNPQLLQKLTQPATANPSPAVPSQPPTNPVSQVIAGTPADAATALRAVGNAGPLGTAPGSSRIIRDAPTIPSAADPQHTVATKINVAGGGQVTIPAYDGGSAPDGGIYVNGHAMTHDARGNLVADLTRGSGPGAPPTIPGAYASGLGGVAAPASPAVSGGYASGLGGVAAPASIPQVPAAREPLKPLDGPLATARDAAQDAGIKVGNPGPIASNDQFVPMMASEVEASKSQPAPAPTRTLTPTGLPVAPPTNNLATTPPAASSPLKFPDAPKIGEMPKPLSPPTGMLGATTPSASGFGDSGVAAAKPPTIPGPGVFDEPRKLTLQTGITAPSAPTIPTTPSLDDEQKRLASAAGL